MGGQRLGGSGGPAKRNGGMASQRRTSDLPLTRILEWLQWYGVFALLLIFLFNLASIRTGLEYWLAWTLETWIVVLALSCAILVFGLVAHRPVERSLGVTLAVFFLVLTPGSAFATWFFRSSGSWLVLFSITLLASGEFARWTRPNGTAAES